MKQEMLKFLSIAQSKRRENKQILEKISKSKSPHLDHFFREESEGFLRNSVAWTVPIVVKQQVQFSEMLI